MFLLFFVLGMGCVHSVYLCNVVYSIEGIMSLSLSLMSVSPVLGSLRFSCILLIYCLMDFFCAWIDILLKTFRPTEYSSLVTIISIYSASDKKYMCSVVNENWQHPLSIQCVTTVLFTCSWIQYNYKLSFPKPYDGKLYECNFTSVTQFVIGSF